ncbi:MAG: SPOR domain-containing protein [Burkholderiaceae bacterium]|jgi:cell division protein FtsN
MSTSRSQTHRTRQHGGTLLGLTLGLLLGLSVALAVAVYVTRSELPFVDRGLTGDATEQASGQATSDWNPNASVVQNVPPAGQPEVSAAPPPAAPASDALVAPAVGSDPLGDLAKQKLATASAPVVTLPPTNAVGAGLSEQAPAVRGERPANVVFFVQIGAFAVADDAEAQRARVAMMGIDARVSTTLSNERTLYRVRSGPYRTRTDADAVRNQLEQQRIEGAVVSVAVVR